jgi:alpha-beta hydrolase superfamily lysophospholipase
MNRTTFLSTAGGALATASFAAAARAAESDIALSTATGTLYGTLALPAKLPAPVVLVVAGSGPTDRNGNNGPVRGNTYALLAAALAARGIASVRYDKRGIAASAAAMPSESEIRFDAYVDDAAAWLRLLAADRRFSKTVLAGHSEGSLVGMIAVQRAPSAAFVSLEGAGRPAQVVLREQLKPKVPPALYAQADVTITQLEQGHTVADPPAELASLFRPSVQPYLISWFKYDPAVEIAKVAVPVTIVQGTADIQVTMTDANALKQGHPTAAFDVVHGMNHVLKYAPDTSSQAAIVQGYENPSLPIDPHAVDAVASAA